MILTDDNFTTMVRAGRLARGLYNNLVKYIHFQIGMLTYQMIVTFLGTTSSTSPATGLVPAAPDPVGRPRDAVAPDQ